MSDGNTGPGPFPEFDEKNIDGFVQALYEWSIKNCQYYIDWYENKKRYMKTGSQYIRGTTIILSGMGALCPLVGNRYDPGFDLMSLGYILLAIAGVLILLDKFYGFSSGWMRFMNAIMQLDKMQRDCQYKWRLMHVDKTKPTLVKQITFLKNFTEKVENLVIAETQKWMQEFENSIAKTEAINTKNHK